MGDRLSRVSQPRLSACVKNPGAAAHFLAIETVVCRHRAPRWGIVGGRASVVTAARA